MVFRFRVSIRSGSRGRTTVRHAAYLCIALTLVLGVAFVTPGKAWAKERYDCNGRNNTYVAAAFWATPLGGGSQDYKVDLECGVGGSYGWGIRHIISPDAPIEDEPLRQHFAGYLTDWEAYSFAEALRGTAWLEPSGALMYYVYAPIYRSGVQIGSQTFTVIVDIRTSPALIKTAWGDPEDIRDITHTYDKETGWNIPVDFNDLVLKK